MQDITTSNGTQAKYNSMV